ncbi:ArsR/SmtB family transcription factor [Bacillus manliponensis]|uniref:ArsR/SmtB family transcription factor n=1 Tax=Bacillus manliponensis TaxID=574376 RepID=UPI003512BBCD
MKTKNELEILSVIKALNDPIRIQVLYVLKNGRDDESLLPQSPDLHAAICPKDILRLILKEGIHVSYSKLSYHLKEMKVAGIISEKREGKNIYYQLNREPLLKMASWLSTM